MPSSEPFSLRLPLSLEDVPGSSCGVTRARLDARGHRARVSCGAGISADDLCLIPEAGARLLRNNAQHFLLTLTMRRLGSRFGLGSERG